jgi:hypothetical protein
MTLDAIYIQSFFHPAILSYPSMLYIIPLRYQLAAQVVGCGEIIPGLFKVLVYISRGDAV